jgi:hypothetical protein
MESSHTQLDNVTDNAHDEETDTDGLADLEKFALVGLTVCETISRCIPEEEGDVAVVRHTCSG